MVKWGQLVWPKTACAKGDRWTGSQVLIFTVTTYGRTHQSTKTPLSHFYEPCPVAHNGYMLREKQTWLPLFVLLLIATYKQDLQSHIFIMSSVCHEPDLKQNCLYCGRLDVDDVSLADVAM